jgi:enoyl-CoA hydratase/carnithine racemase
MESSTSTPETTMSDHILVEQLEGVATVVFNRPKVRNAISLAMWGEIAEIAKRLGDDDSVRAILFRGAGQEAFASGADISEFKENRKDRESALLYNRIVEEAEIAIRNCPKPTVAMIFGFCMGGGMAIALACDLRFAAEGSKFGIPAAKLGIVYDFDAVRQLVDLVGPAYAKDILYSARSVPAEEAFRIGLIQRLAPAAELEGRTLEYLKTVAANAPLSIRGAKAQMAAIFDGSTVVHREQMQAARLATFDSEDYKEGTRAFLEKRPPRFTGR